MNVFNDRAPYTWMTLRKTAIEILEATYACGKINRDEFLQKRDDLQKK